jgi:hypothetical protein
MYLNVSYEILYPITYFTVYLTVSVLKLRDTNAAMFGVHFVVHAAREGHASLPAEGAVVKLTDTDWLNRRTPGSTAAHNPDANPLLIESRQILC